MAKGSDPYGSTETATEYDGRERASSPAGKARSGWALAMAVILLIGAGAAMTFWSGDGTDPAPNGSTGAGVVRESSPASNKN